MVVSMPKPKCILQLCQKCFYSGIHMTLECRDTSFWVHHDSQCLTLKGRANKGFNMDMQWCA
jgi:hypothetical protein